jgi:transposase
VANASPHEVTLVDETLDAAWTDRLPDRLVGDKAYDSDALDVRLLEERGVELISPHRSNRRSATQDGRPLRRYRRRWKVERLFAWLHNFRRLVVRYEYHAANFLGMLQLGCILILLRRF